MVALSTSPSRSSRDNVSVICRKHQLPPLIGMPSTRSILDTRTAIGWHGAAEGRLLVVCHLWPLLIRGHALLHVLIRCSDESATKTIAIHDEQGSSASSSLLSQLTALGLPLSRSNVYSATERTLKRRREPQPRLSRVEMPVVGFVPSAYLHSFCSALKDTVSIMVTLS